MRRAMPDDVVLRRYLGADRLRTMPRPGRQRRVVLEQLAQRFEIGRHHTEAEVDARLRPLWDDVAALRRYLVDEPLLDRGQGLYRRIGGPVEL